MQLMPTTEGVAQMDITVSRADLVTELDRVQGVVDRKATIPILANVLLTVEHAGVVKFAATDMEIALRSYCAADVAGAGAMTLPARKLHEIVRALPDGPVRIWQEKGGARVACGQFTSRLQTMDPADFPSLPVSDADRGVAIPQRALRGLLARTRFAITGEDTRYFMNGAKLEIGDGVVSLIATDGHRLAVDRADVAGVVAADDVILPSKTVDELIGLVPDDDESEAVVTFERGRNHLFFGVNGRTLISRMIDGMFPAYERVIPNASLYTSVVETDRAALAAAIRRVMLMSNERSRTVRFALAPGALTVTASSVELGDAAEPIAADYAGPEMAVSFNGSYVADFLEVAGTERVALSLKDDASAGILNPVGAVGHRYTYVVMPVRA